MLPVASAMPRWNSRSCATRSSTSAAWSTLSTTSRRPAIASLVGVPRRERRRGGLEDAAHREDLEHRLVVVEVDDERHGLEQQARLEARDVRAVAASHVEHPDHLERLHRLAQRRAGEPEPLAELLLGRQPVAGRELAREDHLLDAQDRFVGDRHATHRTVSGRRHPISTRRARGASTRSCATAPTARPRPAAPRPRTGRPSAAAPLRSARSPVSSTSGARVTRIAT